MIGLFGEEGKLLSLLNLRPDLIYVDYRKLNSFRGNVVPVFWVPATGNLKDGVEDFRGQEFLFAFNNSGCVVKLHHVHKRFEDTINMVSKQGFRVLMLDALRFPSPHDGFFFLTTCFCEHCLAENSTLGDLRRHMEEILNLGKVDLDSLREYLNLLASARRDLVNLVLGEIHDYASLVGVKLIAAVFPYPLSMFVGQEPRVLLRYLEEVHVMLYHRCNGAACLNKEIATLVDTLSSLGLTLEEILEGIKYLTGLDLKPFEVRNLLTKGLDIEYIRKLIDVNARIYGGKFIPIIWLDNETVRLGKELIKKYEYVDFFASK